MTTKRVWGVTLRNERPDLRLAYEFLVDRLGLPTAPLGESIALDELAPELLTALAGMLNRPLSAAQRDPHGRLLPNGLVHEPAGDRMSMDVLDKVRRAFAQRGLPLVRKWPWRDGRPFGAALSHDVDLHLLWRMRTVLSYALKRRSLVGVRFMTRGARDPWWTYEEILEIERRNNSHSTFFFAAGGKHAEDPTYRIESRRMRALVAQLHSRGWEIGLHGSYLAAENDDLMGRERVRFERATGISVDTYRQHYLRFLANSPQRIRKTGFGIDSSLGTEFSLGFLDGVSTPHVLDGLLELPVSLMDTCFTPQSDIHNAYQTAGSKASAIRQVISNARKVSGMVVVDWHQNYFADDEFRRLYGDILDETSDADRGGVRDLAFWWETRNRAYLRAVETGWTITGDSLPPGFAIAVSNGDVSTVNPVAKARMGEEDVYVFNSNGPWTFEVR